MAAAATACWLAGFVNAFNFMDGVNGISGAHALIGGVVYACLAGWRRDGFGVAAGLALAVGAAAFLPWNAVRARVFLGDVGSYSIGAALAVLAVRLVMLGVPAEAVGRPGGAVPGGRGLDAAAAGARAASGGLRRTAPTSTSAGAMRGGRTRRSRC